MKQVPFLLAWSLLWSAGPLRAAETFRVATYNLNNYVDDPGAARPLKTEASRAKIRESIRALRAGVVALQEMGGIQSLTELRQSLKAEGMDYPHSEILFGSDTNIHLAVLSKFPVTACHRHTNDTYLLMGRRMRVQRGFLEVQFQVNPNYMFTAFIAHLKSRRQAAVADEAEMRLQEALLLREKIDALLKSHPKANFLVLDDMNATLREWGSRRLVSEEEDEADEPLAES
ncbi:MAG: endonuclease/exonuclease/phosphatase family protein [Verrucomicrobia bacterium]|nr:endonuclease/exonuclease/phosphatase family protein [Verrucomicrobiota bacterium]